MTSPVVKTTPDPKTQHKAVSTPESEASARIADLQTRLSALKLEIRTATGRLTNADPKAVSLLEKENETLRSRETALRKALYGLMMDADKPRQMDEAEQALEILRRAAVEYFKKANVAPEIWKNIES
ncbi:MAG: hypothetical protein A2X94_17360 [Bdellovibrionales bacterium GWB1_55_8]|nr:MAG: hypothetical protein A2X94_17360 [Bdellovibrionales bacterium GWB1_55_8]